MCLNTNSRLGTSIQGNASTVQVLDSLVELVTANHSAVPVAEPASAFGEETFTIIGPPPVPVAVSAPGPVPVPATGPVPIIPTVVEYTPVPPQKCFDVYETICGGPISGQTTRPWCKPTTTGPGRERTFISMNLPTRSWFLNSLPTWAQRSSTLACAKGIFGTVSTGTFAEGVARRGRLLRHGQPQMLVPEKPAGRLIISIAVEWHTSPTRMPLTMRWAMIAQHSSKIEQCLRTRFLEFLASG
ncbi:hypothetical protein CLU79DRAFT_842176 [Phycomyces nitens]|nr:hypothetical protein CLU79DRAFT_842176 [Phycomyces nitens]